MKKLGILIDSTSTFDRAELNKFNIEVISNSINDVDGNVYLDECTDEQKFLLGSKIEEDVVFKTSLINCDDIEKKVKQMLETYEQVIFLCIGPGFSGQYQNAINVASKFLDKQLIVLHSNSTACQSEIVLHWLLEYLKQNKEINQTLMQQEIIDLSNHITTMFTTNNYKGFVNTGRVPAIVAKTLKLTKMFPIICAEEINTRAKFYRKWIHSLENVLEAVDKRFNIAPRANNIKELYLCQSLCNKETIDEILDMMAKHFEYDRDKIKIRSTPLCVLMTTSLYSFGIAILTSNDVFKKKKH